MNDWGPLIKSINVKQNFYSIQKKIPAAFSLRHSPYLKNYPNTNNIQFEKIARILIGIIFGFKKSPKYEFEY